MHSWNKVSSNDITAVQQMNLLLFVDFCINSLYLHALFAFAVLYYLNIWTIANIADN